MIFICGDNDRRRLCIALFVLIAQCSAYAAAQENAVTAQIGFIAASDMSNYQTNKLAAQYAIDEANARDLRINGKKLRFALLIQDDRGNANLAGSVANYLIRNSIVGVVGPWSSDTALASAKLYSDAHIPMIFPILSSKPMLPTTIKGAFSPAGDPTEAALFYANVCADQLQVRKLAVIDDRSSFGVNFADRFIDMMVQRGAQITSRESISTRTSDFNAVLATVTRVKPDTILFTGDAMQSVAIVRAMKRQDMNFRLLLIGGTNSTEQLREDINVPLFSVESGASLDISNDWKNLQKQHLSKHGAALGGNARFSYDAINLIVSAVQKAQSLAPVEVSAALYRNRLVGSSQTISFDEKGKLRQPTYAVYQYNAARWTVLKSSKEADK